MLSISLFIDPYVSLSIFTYLSIYRIFMFSPLTDKPVRVQMSPAGLKFFKAHLKSACPVEVTEAKTVATPFIDVAPQHEPSLQNFLNESLYQDHYPVSTEIFDQKIITQTIQSLKKRLQDEKSNAILHPLLQMKCPLGDCKCQPKDTAALKLHIRKYCNFSVQNTGADTNFC